MELHIYLHLKTIDKPSSLILTYLYDSFNRIHHMVKYIEVDGLDFGSIPKFKKQSTLLFKFIP